MDVFVSYKPGNMMKFCEVCNNLLHPRENRELKKLEYVCKSSVCNYIDSSAVEEGLVYRNDVVKDTATNLRAILSDNNKDPTLTRSTGTYHVPKPCVHCTHTFFTACNIQ